MGHFNIPDGRTAFINPEKGHNRLKDVDCAINCHNESQINNVEFGVESSYVYQCVCM